MDFNPLLEDYNEIFSNLLPFILSLKRFLLDIVGHKCIIHIALRINNLKIIFSDNTSVFYTYLNWWL